jgi:hypothetical protein
MNSEHLADKVWSWFIRQPGQPSLADIDATLRELAGDVPAFVIANARRRLFEKINAIEWGQFVWERT